MINIVVAKRTGAVGHLVLEGAHAEATAPRLGRAEICETLRRLHPLLKKQAFLNAKEAARAGLAAGSIACDRRARAIQPHTI